METTEVPQEAEEEEAEEEAPDIQIIHRPQRVICTGNLGRKVGHVQTDITVLGEISRALGQGTTGTSLLPQKLLIEKMTNLTRKC